MNNKPFSIISIVILSFIIVASIGYTTSQFYNVEQRLTQNTEEIFHKNVDASFDIIDTTVNESLKSYLHGILFSIKQLIETSEPLHLNQTKLAETLSRFISQTRVGKGGYISIIDPNGKLLFHPYTQGENISEHSFIQQQLNQDETFIEYEWQNPGESTKRLKISHSLKLANGNIINVSVYKDEMMDLIDKHTMTKKLRRYNFEDKGYVYVINNEGTLILHPTNEGESIRTLIGDSTDEFIQTAHKKSEGRFTYPLLRPNGTTVTKTVAYKYYPYLDWIIASGISEKELTRPTDQLRHGLIMALISLGLIIASLIYGLNSRHKRILMIERRDGLTGLTNRRYVMKYTETLEQKSAMLFSVIILDIDKFKRINDTYGHHEGDEAILATANILKQFEHSKVTVSRYGGEEFLIIMQEASQYQAYILAEIIRQRVSEIDHLQTRFTISAGVYQSQIGTENITDAISQADYALYQAKQNGRNKVMIYQDCFEAINHGDKN